MKRYINILYRIDDFGNNFDTIDTKKTNEQSKWNYSSPNETIKDIQKREANTKEDADKFLKESLWLDDIENVNTSEKYLDSFFEAVINMVHDSKISNKWLSKFEDILKSFKDRIMEWEDVRDELFNKIEREIPEEAKYINEALSEWIIMSTGEEVDFEKTLAGSFEKRWIKIDIFNTDASVNNNTFPEHKESHFNSSNEEIRRDLNKYYTQWEFAATIDYIWLEKTFGEEISTAVTLISWDNNLTPQQKSEIALEYVLYKRWLANLNELNNNKYILELDKNIIETEEHKEKYFNA